MALTASSTAWNPMLYGSCVMAPRKYLSLTAAFCALPASNPTTARPGYWVGRAAPSLEAERMARAVPSLEQKMPRMLLDFTLFRIAAAVLVASVSLGDAGTCTSMMTAFPVVGLSAAI